MTLFLTVGVRDTNHRDEFHITTFFRVRFAKGASLLVHWSFSFGVIQIRCSVQKLSSFRITFGGSIWTRGIYFTDCTVIALLNAQDRLSLLCFYTGASRLWWASVLLLSEPRQSVHTVRVPYQPSVFAPFFLKSAGWVLIWTSAVLLWFLALLYTHELVLSIRRMHNELDILFQETTNKLWESYKERDEKLSLIQNHLWRWTGEAVQ